MPRLLSRAVGFVAIVAGVTVLWSRAPINAGAVDDADVPAVQAGGAPTARIRIGTYDGRAIAVAFAPSQANKGHIAELLRQTKEAEAAGDTWKVAELRARGAALQTVRHLQAFGNAPVDDILDHVRDRLPEVARKAGVRVIVRQVDFRDATVEAVDVTEQLVALFDPNERTLKTVLELRNHKPMTLDAILVAEREEHNPRK